jgi:glycosyltransferase involved in cell wall biosynthesis
MAQVSIVVPVYEVEKYIRKCIESIQAQTFSDFELILVDDGSKDASGRICDEYAKKDKRIRVIHKENKGVSEARNDGIKDSMGEYICFIDADDWIEKTMLESCINNIIETDSDAVCHGYKQELWKGESIVNVEEKNVTDSFETLTHDDISEKMEVFWSCCSNYVWNYLFKREIIKEESFPDIKISEDHIFVLNILKKCRKLSFLKDVSYHYCMRMGSTANRWDDTGLFCQIKMIEACNGFMEEFEISESRKRKLMAQITLNAYSYAIYMFCFPECKLSIREKMSQLKNMKNQLKIDELIPYATVQDLSLLEKIKKKCICWKLERILLLTGPVFMKIVRRAG